MSKEIQLHKGDVSDNGQITIVDEDRLCYVVLSESRGSSGLRTISKAILGEFVEFVKSKPDAAPREAREALSGQSKIDKYEYGYESTISNMVRYVNDIAGIRIICSFTSDIYRIAEMISNQKDIQVLTVKDYIMNPKNSGYRSYHMIVSLPVYLSDRIVNVKVEIQIRTVAMDFWASLEHKIYYKFEGNNTSGSHKAESISLRRDSETEIFFSHCDINFLSSFNSCLF